MIDPCTVLRILSRDRPVFHSEADFQHAFAWQLHMDYPDLRIRLEYPFHRKDEKIDYVDIVAFDKDETTAFEMKYKTAPFFALLKEDLFYLKGHSAQDLGRYDFLKDIYRVEKYVTERKNWTGYAILLTNDSAYWNPTNRAESVCDQFRLTDQRLIMYPSDYSDGRRATRETTPRLVRPPAHWPADRPTARTGRSVLPGPLFRQAAGASDRR